MLVLQVYELIENLNNYDLATVTNTVTNTV